MVVLHHRKEILVITPQPPVAEQLVGRKCGHALRVLPQDEVVESSLCSQTSRFKLIL
jgi:hypothetical protein